MACTLASFDFSGGFYFFQFCLLLVSVYNLLFWHFPIWRQSMCYCGLGTFNQKGEEKMPCNKAPSMGSWTDIIFSLKSEGNLEASWPFILTLNLCLEGLKKGFQSLTHHFIKCKILLCFNLFIKIAAILILINECVYAFYQQAFI